MLENLAIQLIGFIGTALFFLSYQFKKNKSLFRVQFLSYMFYTIHLILLGAVTGGLSYILNMVRSFCLGSSNEFARSKKMCAIICTAQFLVLAFTWNGWISVLPIVANVAATIGGYTHNGRKIRLVAVFVNSPLWIIYDIFVGSWAGILDEVVTGISMVISVIRFGWDELDKEH